MYTELIAKSFDFFLRYLFCKKRMHGEKNWLQEAVGIKTLTCSGSTETGNGRNKVYEDLDTMELRSQV